MLWDPVTHLVPGLMAAGVLTMHSSSIPEGALTHKLDSQVNPEERVRNLSRREPGQAGREDGCNADVALVGCVLRFLVFLQT